MSFQSINSQRKLILIAAAIGVISVFLPWVTVSIMGMGQSVSGFRGAGIVVFLSFASAIIISLMGNQSTKLEKAMWMLVLAAGIIAFLFTIISFGNKSSAFGDSFGLFDAGYGIGIWMALFCSLGVIASAWLFKNPGDNLKDSFEDLKTGTFPRQNSAGGNKIAELEKLIELKNQGKISEEEYQELKSKII